LLTFPQDRALKGGFKKRGGPAEVRQKIKNNPKKRKISRVILTPNHGTKRKREIRKMRREEQGPPNKKPARG